MNNADPCTQETTGASDGASAGTSAGVSAGTTQAQPGTITPAPASAPPGGDTVPPPDQLPALRAEFPCFRIWRERTCDRDRYVARSLHLGTNPHTVVTADVEELRAALEPARHAACPRPHAPGEAAQGQARP